MAMFSKTQSLSLSQIILVKNPSKWDSRLTGGRTVENAYFESFHSHGDVVSRPEGLVNVAVLTPAQFVLHDDVHAVEFPILVHVQMPALGLFAHGGHRVTQYEDEAVGVARMMPD